MRILRDRTAIQARAADIRESLKMYWRRGSGSNRRIKVLQTFALPLGYRALRDSLLAKYRAFDRQVKLGGPAPGLIFAAPATTRTARSRTRTRPRCQAAAASSPAAGWPRG